MISIPRNKIDKFIQKKCERSGINLPDSFIVLSGNNAVIRVIADSYNAQMINNNPIFTEYVCNNDDGCVILKSVNQGDISDDRIRLYASDSNKHTSARFNLHDVVGGDCYEW